MPTMDLLGVTFVKCTIGNGTNFQKVFKRDWLGQIWPNGTSGEEAGSIRPIFLATVTGYFDFMIGFTSDSSKTVTNFILHELRSNTSDNQLTEFIADTQSTVGVLSAHVAIQDSEELYQE